jgi:pilus assembly protein Flp/PilA
MKLIKKFLKNESGATAIEYGLIAAAMGLALVTVMPTLAGAIQGKFGDIATDVSTPTVIVP